MKKEEKSKDFNEEGKAVESDVENESEENKESSGENEASELEKSLRNLQKNLDFSQISWPQVKIETESISLEGIAGEQPKPVFVGTMPQSSSKNTLGENNENNDFKYVPSSGGSNEPKYISSPEKISVNTERFDPLKAGRESNLNSLQNREAQFVEYYKSDIDSPTVEKVWRPERFDIEKAGRENPTEREEVKYKNYKPKLPDSR